MRSFGFIYKHTHRSNGKVYVGQSTDLPHRRWRKGAKNYGPYRTCPAFYPALKKYTWEVFDSEILVWASNIETLDRLEEFYINYYNCIAPNGYNTRKTSNGRGKQAESTKKILSEQKIELFNKMREAGIKIEPPNRIEHKVINDIVYKHCGGNDGRNHWDLIEKFGADKNTWDGLNRKCRECHNAYRSRYKWKGLTPEEFQASYKDRQKYNRKNS